jgi:hypothetical protein
MGTRIFGTDKLVSRLITCREQRLGSSLAGTEIVGWCWNNLAFVAQFIDR